MLSPVFATNPTSINRTTIFCMATLIPVASSFAASSQADMDDPSRPNIIHIMADDLGWRDLSCYGSETFQTPNIDALARRGMIFSNAYSASPLCSPTRAATHRPDGGAPALHRADGARTQ
jgi:hypothetical protein